MKRALLVLSFWICLFLFGYTEGRADTLNLQTLPSTTYGGYYVGPVGGNLNGGSPMGFICDDFFTTTVVPGSFAVTVSTLDNVSGTKFGGTVDGLFKYQQVGWLTSQMQNNPGQTAQIQFAIWSIFAPSTPVVPGAQAWVDAARSINPGDFDFSSVKVFTPSNTTNQEFVSGGAVAVPEPGSLLLLGTGFVLLYIAKKRRARL